MGVLYCGWEGGCIVEVCFDYFNALGCECLRFWLAGVAGYSPERVLLGESRVGEDGGDDGVALLAGCTEDDEFGHSDDFCGR